jgi:calcium-dependent protein kinase
MEDILGKGNYGTVYMAWKQKTLKGKTQIEEVYPEFACKIIEKTKIKTTSMHLIENEIAILSKIRSEKIVRLHGAYKTSKRYYMILDICNGGDLFGLLQAKGRLMEEEAKLILI